MRPSSLDRVLRGVRAILAFPPRRTKIEKEKKEHARLHGMIRTEVSGAEIAEEMEKERRFFQLQMCEVRCWRCWGFLARVPVSIPMRVGASESPRCIVGFPWSGFLKGGALSLPTGVGTCCGHFSSSGSRGVDRVGQG